MSTLKNCIKGSQLPPSAQTKVPMRSKLSIAGRYQIRKYTQNLGPDSHLQLSLPSSPSPFNVKASKPSFRSVCILSHEIHQLILSGPTQFQLMYFIKNNISNLQIITLQVCKHFIFQKGCKSIAAFSSKQLQTQQTTVNTANNCRQVVIYYIHIKPLPMLLILIQILLSMFLACLITMFLLRVEGKGWRSSLNYKS